jgi:hypothetical protein
MSLILSGTDGLSDIDGSAATPAIRGTDANTGIFFPAADTIAFSEGGAEAMRIDSSGNVGIGTSTIYTRLQVLSSGTDNTAGDSIASAIASFTGPNYAIGTAANPANLQVMSNSTLGADVGASIGLGGRYSTTQFAQFALIKGAKENATTGQYGTYLAFGTRANGSDITERMRISSAGYVTYTANPAFNASLNGSTQYVTSGSTVTLTFGTASFNRGSAYNASTYIFTAPVAGMYQFNARARVDGITGGLNYAILALVTSGKTYNDICSASGSYNNLTIAVATYMSLGDTAYVTLNSSGQTINAVNTQPVYSDFSGFLIG